MIRFVISVALIIIITVIMMMVVFGSDMMAAYTKSVCDDARRTGHTSQLRECEAMLTEMRSLYVCSVNSDICWLEER